MVAGPARVHISNDISIGSAVLAELTYRVGQKSKLLILGEYVNKT